MGKIIEEPFGRIMPFAENVERLQPFLKVARRLNKLRNKVAVHPLCFWPFQTFPDDELANKVIVQDLKIIAAADTEDEQSFIIREARAHVLTCLSFTFPCPALKCPCGRACKFI